MGHINQTRAQSSRARGARRPIDVGQRTDPRSDRPAGAACWPAVANSFSRIVVGRFRFGANAGARAFGANADADVAAAAGRAVELQGRRKQPALNHQQFSGAHYTKLALNPRAREGRADRSTLVSGPTRDPTDPLAPPAGRPSPFFFANCCWRIPVRGERWSSGVRGER